VASYENKTLPTKEEGNEEICADRGRVVVIELIVEPVVVPVPLLAVPVEVADHQVAVRVPVKYNLPPVPPPFEYSQG
jgi:hypothetical protein